MESATVSSASASLQYGIGVFDGLMAYRNGGRTLLFQARPHLERFVASSASMGLSLPWTVDQVHDAISDLLGALEARDWYIRPVAVLPEPRIDLTSAAPEQPARLAVFAMRVHRGGGVPLRCHVSPYERVSGRAIPVRWKTFGAYTNSFMVRREAQRCGFDDGLMLDREGRVAELSAANLFLLRGSTLVTPVLTDDIFPGVTRSVVLRLARDLGLELEERTVVPGELAGFEAAFAGATFMELRPVACIGEAGYASERNPCFVRLLDAFRELTNAAH